MRYSLFTVKKWLPFIALGVGVFFFIAFEPPGKDTLETSGRNGRYQLVNALTDFNSAAGPGNAHIVFKVDTATGRTWIFYSSTNAVNWREIHDAQ